MVSKLLSLGLSWEPGQFTCEFVANVRVNDKEKTVGGQIDVERAIRIIEGDPSELKDFLLYASSKMKG